MERRTWGNTWRYVAGIVACLFMGYFGFVRNTRVPPLGLVDLGFHELGHLVTYWMSDVICAAMGSINQVLVPLGCASYFLLRPGRRDLLAAGVCLAWAGTSAQDVSTYIADAPYQRLHLIGGIHDWAFVLGPQHLDHLDWAAPIAATVKTLGGILILAGVAAPASTDWCGRTVRRVARSDPRPAGPCRRARST